MRGALRRVCGIAIACGLSCAVRDPFPRGFPDAPVPPSPRAIAQPTTDAATERVLRLFSRYQMRLSPEEVERAARAVVHEVARNRLALDLVLAVMRVESGFNNFATSRVGALGLMQVMPATGERVARDIGIDWHGPRTLYDPVSNVRIGTAYLAKMYRRYRSMDKALAAYNWGPARIDRRLRHGRVLPVRYVAQVHDARSTLRPGS